MNKNYGVVNNGFTRKIVHEYNAFMEETRAKVEETRRATMISLKKLLKLKDGDVIEIQEDDTLRIISTTEEVVNGGK
jgi:flagellar motor switch protein FliM